MKFDALVEGHARTVTLSLAFTELFPFLTFANACPEHISENIEGN